MSGWSAIRWPMFDPEPGRMLMTPFGKPALTTSSANCEDAATIRSDGRPSSGPRLQDSRRVHYNDTNNATVSQFPRRIRRGYENRFVLKAYYGRQSRYCLTCYLFAAGFLLNNIEIRSLLSHKNTLAMVP